MKSVLTLQEMALSAVNQKLILQGVGWDFYEEILKEFENSNALHFAYDNGFLEVEVPTTKHEAPNRILQTIVQDICFEIGQEFYNVGSATFRKRVKAKGVEPDTCFYIQNQAKIQDKSDIDLSQDPPPDLVIEVDITSPSLKKLPIYAALGVPEVWLYKGETVEFYQLDGDEYRKIDYSIALPILSSQKATEFLDIGLSENPSVCVRAVREWARDKR